MVRQPLKYRCFGVVALAPRPIWKRIFRHILNNGIKNYAIAAHGDQRRISIQLGQDVVVGVIGIEANLYLR